MFYDEEFAQEQCKRKNAKIGVNQEEAFNRSGWNDECKVQWMWKAAFIVVSGESWLATKSLVAAYIATATCVCVCVALENSSRFFLPHVQKAAEYPESERVRKKEPGVSDLIDI